ncbi:Reverse transcriptase zinc-binding domain [Macleaya cordata]|uniref:Reverse transcriptase zinc-binding domain n=1 Tax=Macleaya cordata TaxID=56857 RepID=A0A200QIL8_MACCD|nr:Reverse transcriptase zinc-binding domain [Macleaya cordata]
MSLMPTVRIVGDGNFIDPWCDRWIPELGVATPKPNTSPDSLLKVSDFIEPATRTWDRVKLNQHFDQSSIERIVKIPLSVSPSSDRRAWDLTRDGKFTTKSAYHGLRGIRDDPTSKVWKKIWRTKIPYRVQVFIWRCAKNALPTRDNLSLRVQLPSILCPFCQTSPETIMHVLITCPISSRIWFQSRLNMRTVAFLGKPIMDWFRFCLGEAPFLYSQEKDESFPLVACLMWSIWLSRNNMIHNAKTDSPFLIIN